MIWDLLTWETASYQTILPQLSLDDVLKLVPSCYMREGAASKLFSEDPFSVEFTTWSKTI